MRFEPFVVALVLAVLPACAHENAVQGRASLRAAAAELIHQGHPNVAQAMLEPGVAATEAELADLYRALGEACQAMGQQAKADQWFQKSIALKKFSRVSSPPLPMPVERPVTNLP